jgi:chemotaxis protein methyltransferase CheR
VTAAVSPIDLVRFRAVVASCLGLQFEESRFGELAEVLARVGGASLAGRETYLARLEGTPARDDIRALARQLTVGETYFFRNYEQYRAFAEVALAGPSTSGLVRILCAGCASGEEAYSLAMVACERLGNATERVSITAFDVNPAALERAAEGRYSAWSLRETSAEVRRRWFVPAARDYLVHPSVRSMVRFEERNLAREAQDFWVPGAYDVVFFRNVLMYLTAETARAVMGRIGRALAPGGHLFLGHAESLRDHSREFRLCQTHGTFYYQRQDAATAPEKSASERADAAPSLESSAPLTGEAHLDWIETVRRSTDRIRELSERSNADATPRAPVVTGTSATEVMELLARERFVEALALLDHAPSGDADPELLLLRAVLLTHLGQLPAAETVCSELRGRGAASAGAHYLLALCREGAGDLEGAMENDRIAAYLDHAFAMPRLHLGLLARRAGDLPAARSELAHALALLTDEDAARVLLFGGGFTREALTRLCRAELRASGDAW